MALILELNITNFPEAKTDVNYKVVDSNLDHVKAGTVDIGSDGAVSLIMAGSGVQLTDWVKSTFDDYDGANFTTTGEASDWSQVTDDGALPPTVFTLLAMGDSLTATGAISDGARPSKGNVKMFFSNYWCTAAYIHSSQDYIYRPDMGKSGEQTTGMLNKITQYTDSDADLIMLHIGTNDFKQVSIATTKSNYTDIVNALLASGKKVLCIPCHHRNNGAESAAKNLDADELNAHILTLAQNNSDVEMSPVDTAMNALMMTHGNDGVVSDDGLHWNNLGGILAGVIPGQSLDTFFPSTFTKFNLAPNSFTGTGGSLGGTSTGVMPDGYHGSGTGCEFTGPIDRGDGKVWWKIQTDGSLSQGASLFELKDVTTEEAMYQCEWLIEFEQGAELVDRLEILVNSAGATWNASDYNTELTVTSVGMVENDTEYLIKSPTGVFDAGLGGCNIESRQVTGVDVIMYVTSNKFYKVEDGIVV